MRVGKSTLLLVALLGPSSGLGAEDVLAPGARLRVTAPFHSKHQLVGTLIGEEADSLRLDVGKEVVTLPRRSVTKLEVSTRRGHRRLGALIGAVAGAAAGAAIGAANHAQCEESQPNFLFGGCLFTKQEDMAMTAIAGAPVGAVLGALIAPGAKWEAIPSQRVRVSLAPMRGRGFAAQLTIGFSGRTR